MSAHAACCRASGSASSHAGADASTSSAVPTFPSTTAATRADGRAALGQGAHVVIGTSGLTEKDYAEIDAGTRQKAP